MGIKIALHHESRYRYERPVSLGPQTILLRPAPHCQTPISSYSLAITPPDSTPTWQFDPLANHVARVIFPSKTAEFCVTIDLVAEMVPINPFAFLLEPGAETVPFRYKPESARDLRPFLTPDPAGSQLNKFLDRVRGTQSTVSFLLGLNAQVRDRVSYTTRLEHGVQTPEQTLQMGTGSCRDSSWLLVQACRHLGIAARFVSGYLVQLAQDEASPGEDIRTVDSADLHAWVEVYLPGAGWIGMDPTSGLLTAEGHIPLACGTTPADVAPINGTVEPAGVEFTHTLTVRRLNEKPDEKPSLTTPFSDQEWQQVRELAYQVDRDVKAQDIRLTMGGEPTYVGIDDPESPQWNVAALGAAKRTAGLSLIRSLRERTAPGGLLHLGQGKWYPGEPLPRWAFHCISRKDGVPVWENGDLFALESQNDGYENADAFAFLEALARRLGAQPENILPAMEPWEGEQELAGYVLPLRRRQPNGQLAWSSQLWFERPERFTLSPGDSPIGYRIPVETMPWVAPDSIAYDLDEDGQIALPKSAARRPERFALDPSPDPLSAIAADAASAPELIRPSLCVQTRDGRLHVFLPYVPVLADYLDLVSAIEDTSAHLKKRVWIEGYSAPFDLRTRVFSLTPDPGVLEVNLPATSEWDELEALNKVLSEEAQRHRLIAGKFGYDGTHLATGGGNHITLGGPTLADSPILRRPDVLRSMVSFWQNHPSLSYLFAGMYVGPTSQYPRVDEARVDALYELELAFSHLPPEGCSPEIVDGLFRNLLVDVTGNAHRAEFCIDKLHPPLGQGLRIGLLELRAFEMPPHYRMGLLQTLLVRALFVVFWKNPFAGGLLRWGTSLHDRFMLPHFVERDFLDVLASLRGAGYLFPEKWFAAQMEFRFPKIGSLEAGGVRLELRQALEPWNVLAEETTSGGTGRSVDSSLERIQVKVTGFAAASRYAVSCNGRRVPLHPSGQPDESIAGIRYRARMLSATLHPTIPVHTPLTFDLIDTWQGICVGRCIYYANQPDGTLYNTRPSSASEARERRLRRFVLAPPPEGHVAIPAPETNPVFPMTLDLRWQAPASGTAQDDLPGSEGKA